MSTSILAVNPQEFNTETIEIDAHGRVFEYTITRLTSRCWLLTNPNTGTTRQFNSPAALWAFLGELTQHIGKKYAPKTIPHLPATKIAGLLPAVAGLKPGQCDGWLNAHWSPLATDGMVFEHRGHQYCPHCFSAYHTAMNSIKTQNVA